MGGFADKVRRAIRINPRGSSGERVFRSKRGGSLDELVVGGARALKAVEPLHSDYPTLEMTRAQDLLEVAHRRGDPADMRVALTELQGVLKELTREDSRVAAEDEVQSFRKALHEALDHD